ncbi:hypothetical protein L198_00680 [Cryptococcus wingfieldii CBS 7118]|uniref:Chromo domain-containing protein n=1 Tax=Cryptococcus wingfieldii CBS 7118 TaxID=1295528 RepID=A0A1E3K7A0_9TREE|nr:hypothetical protein L198_00680 [Cryptococcus wingfieldii CBS 7118]ODO08941.1 hypothetical protein L198_00680 [Cryptococcus wingfieldii CBS 7118]
MSSSPSPSSDDDTESIHATQFVPQEDDSDTLYDAIRILDERVNKRGGGEYLVEWAGIDPDTGKTYLPEWTAKTACTNDLIKEWRAVKRRDPDIVGKGAARWDDRIQEYQKWKKELDRKKAKAEREARLKVNAKKRKRSSTVTVKTEKKSRTSKGETPRSKTHSITLKPAGSTTRRRSTRTASEPSETSARTRATRPRESHAERQPVVEQSSSDSEEEPENDELDSDEEDDDAVRQSSAKNKGRAKVEVVPPTKQSANGTKTKPKKRVLPISKDVTDYPEPSQVPTEFAQPSQPNIEEETDPQPTQYPISSPIRPEVSSLNMNPHLPSSADTINQFISPPFMRHEKKEEAARRHLREYEEAEALAKAVASLPGKTASGRTKGKGKERQDEGEEAGVEGAPKEIVVYDLTESWPESQIPQTQPLPASSPKKSTQDETPLSDQDLRKENDKLRMQLKDALEARASMIDTLKYHPDSVALEKVKAENERLKEELAAAQADAEEVRGKGKEEGAEIRLLEGLKREMEGLRKELSAAKIGKDQSDERYNNHPDSSALVHARAEVAELRKLLEAAQQATKEAKKIAKDHPIALKLASAEEQIQTLTAKLQEAKASKNSLQSEIASLTEQLEAAEASRASEAEHQRFVTKEYEKARDRAVELVRKSDVLTKQNQLFRGQLRDGLKQRELFNHATSSAHNAQIKQLRAQVKILLDQARVTGDPIREKAVWCDKYREDSERLTAENEDLDRKLRKAKGRQVELLEENQVLRARAMGVLPPESEGDSDEDEDAARGYMTAEDVPARRPFPPGPSGLGNNHPASPHSDFFLSAPEAQNNFAHPPGTISGAATGLGNVVREEGQVEELVEGGRGYECKWRDREEACKVVCDTAEDMFAHGKQHPVAEMAARGSL